MNIKICKHLGKVTTKKGDTWDKMRLAIGSSKPWVSRSLRPWCVHFRPDLFDGCIQFYWGGCRVSVDMDRFHMVMGELQSNWCTGTTPILIGGAPGMRIAMHTTTIDFYDDDLQEFDLSVPTKLVIEAVRMFHRRILYSSNIEYIPKRLRGRWRRYEKLDRKAFVRKQGSHLRWTVSAKIDRAFEDSKKHADQWPTDPRFRIYQLLTRTQG